MIIYLMKGCITKVSRAGLGKTSNSIIWLANYSIVIPSQLKGRCSIFHSRSNVLMSKCFFIMSKNHEKKIWPRFVLSFSRKT